MPTISVIVPVYKVEKYIHRCVDSILAQTFTDFELILVDDGSPDNCGAICDEYAKKDSRIKVIHKENGGLSSARNAGIDAAGGMYIMFCDSDDYVASDWCDQFLCNVSPSEDNYIFGGMNRSRISENKETITPPPVLYKHSWDISDYLSLQSQSILGYACNVLYYASVFRNHNLRFSEKVIVEDLPFNLVYLQYMKSLTYTGKAGYYYVQDDRETLSRKYYPESFRRWQEKYQVTLSFIDNTIPSEERERNRRTVATNYLYPFLRVLENTFDKRNTKTLCQKIRYNSKVVNSAEFQHCLYYANCGNEDPRIIYLLKKKNYLAVFILQEAYRLKHTILERSKRL